jgi:multidrug resistance efflux pump
MLTPTGSFGRKWSASVREPARSSQLLPPENATGNWVKVVQRLPVRLQLEESVPVQSGLSVLVTVDTNYRHGLFGLEGENGKAMNAKAAQ